ncbi:MAG: hypothetical protein ACRDH9_10480 [Actinomycetota bacterium]
MSEVMQLPLTRTERDLLELIQRHHAVGQLPTFAELVKGLDQTDFQIRMNLRALRRKGALQGLHPTRNDLTKIEFSVDGRPRPQGSKTVMPLKDSMQRVVLVESGGRNLDAWRSICRDMAALHRPPEPWDGPVRGEFVFHLGAPRGDCDWPIGPPDDDKLLRAMFDALQQAGVVANDSQFVDARPIKRFHPQGRFGVDVSLELLPRRGGGSAG